MFDWGTLGRPAIGDRRSELRHVIWTPGATLRHAFYQGGAEVPEHHHAHASIRYGVGGPCFETANDENVIHRRLTYMPRGFRPALRFDGPTHMLAIEIEDVGGRCFSQLLQREVATPLPATLYDLVWVALVKIAEREPIVQVAEALDALFENADGALPLSPDTWIGRVIDHMHRNWRDVPSAQAIAALFGKSPQHLCKAFKIATGVTLQQYSIALRLDYARGLLWGSGMPISEVAAETGFADQSHLTRALGSHLGRTPARLRWRSPCLGGTGIF